MATEKKPIFRNVFGSVALLLAIVLPAQTAADPSAGQAAPVASTDKRKINLILVGYDIENNAAAKKMLEEMAQAAQASGAKGQVLLAGKDNASELQLAMSKAVNIATGQAQAGGGGGGGGAGVLGIPSQGIPSWAIILLAAMGALLLILAVLVLSRRRSTATAGGPARVQASLEVLFPDGRHVVFAISQPRIVIGRGVDNQLILDDGAVSLHHAEILAGEDGFRIRDLGSANGTMVNGRQVEECGLYLGDEIALGPVRITLGR
ncbi:MAG: FHA domain-containing protein [Acidobacteria bacterium]|jgi:hypothetical protein|nr:FHA domain-containing protein [Acidobacteriota bacterium]